jgi:hypothetical protein
VEEKDEGYFTTPVLSLQVTQYEIFLDFQGTGFRSYYLRNRRNTLSEADSKKTHLPGLTYEPPPHPAGMDSHCCNIHYYRISRVQFFHGSRFE